MNEPELIIIGANGQLGKALRQLYPSARAVNHRELDLTDLRAINDFDWSKASIIINAAAYTNVDGAETPDGRRLAWQINASAVAKLAQICTERNITLVHLSSDYVFDGTITLHSESEPFTPLGVYGQSKAAGDLAVTTVPKHYILRTSWVVGDGNNFVRTMISLAKRNIKPSVVNDQIGRLTFVDTLSAGIKSLIDNNAPYGTYNLTNSGEPASWADIAQLVYERCGQSAHDVTAVTTKEYFAGKDNIAPRPFQSTLDLQKISAAGFTPSDWRSELERYLNDSFKTL